MVTRQDLLRAGVTVDEIIRRVRIGALLAEHRGVYRVGHRAAHPEAIYLAAVRACGDKALLAGRSAGWLLSLLRGEPPRPEVILPGERRLPGVQTHRSRRLDPRDATVWRGIPVTTVPRTLVDLAAVLDADELGRACHEAGVRYGTTPREVEAVLERRSSSPGARQLRAVLSGDARITISWLERRFLGRLAEAKLPLPLTNRPTGARGRRLDCRWPDHRLTVEIDSYRFHRSRHAWERDRCREREAYARGDDFRRYTYEDVTERPEPMLRELRALLERPT